MTETNHTLALRGCAPVPLAHYLKALGILRLVSEQPDPQAVGWWENDVFYLRSKYDNCALCDFFLNEYRPTPLVAPWNGGSGFYSKDNQTALQQITGGEAPRFAPYRDLIASCQQLLVDGALTEKPKDDEKPLLLQHCRNRLSDDALSWLDAAFLLTSDGPKYPPLLGTGGNDGRLEFTNNYMQRLTEIMDCDTGVPRSGMDRALSDSLFSELTTERTKASVGQFDPGSAGGANSGAGFDGSSTINLWDFIFMLEGSLAFAAASVKKLESSGPGMLAYPFCVRSTGVGYGSADSADELISRSEMWMPIWDSPASFSTVSTLLAEGRAEIAGNARRKARNGVDFARAIASLGIDRGISEFQRFGFQQRNGLAYFAVPLSRFAVHGRPTAEELLSPIDAWLDRFRRAASGKNAPARAERALRRLESAILKLCQRNSEKDVQELIIALGEAEATVAISKRLREGEKGGGINPLPLLSPNWLFHAADNSAEFRLAAALASVTHKTVGPIRRHVEPIDDTSWKSQWPKWAKEANDPAIVWGSGNLVRNLNAVLARRLVEVLQEGKEKGGNELFMPLGGRCSASLGDIAVFIDDGVNDERIDALFRGLMLLDFGTTSNGRAILADKAKQLAEATSINEPEAALLSLIIRFLPYDRDDKALYANAMRKIEDSERDQESPDARYALLKLCHLPHALDEKAIKLAPQITRRAIAGDGAEATRLAARRLLASGFPPAVGIAACEPDRARRIAAALMFPISKSTAARLKCSVLRMDLLSKEEQEECRW